MRKLKRGDLVKLVVDVSQQKMLEMLGVHSVYATVLECRYKTGICRIFPANNPIVKDPYWIDTKYLVKVE